MDNVTNFLSEHKHAVIGVAIGLAILIVIMVVYFTGVIPSFSSESFSVERQIDSLISSIMSKQKRFK